MLISATSPSYSMRMPLIGASVSWPSERAELFGQRHERLQPRRFLGGDRGEVDRVADRAVQQVVRHLLGHLQRDVLLRLGGGGAEMRRADDVGHGRRAGCCVAGSSTNTSKRGARHMAGLRAPRASAASSTRPPRAQLMMRTPFFVLAMFSADEDVLGLLGQRRVQRDEVGAARAARRARPSRRRSRRRAPATGTDRRR